jgi:hypothetical protein
VTKAELWGGGGIKIQNTTAFILKMRWYVFVPVTCFFACACSPAAAVRVLGLLYLFSGISARFYLLIYKLSSSSLLISPRFLIFLCLKTLKCRITYPRTKVETLQAVINTRGFVEIELFDSVSTVGYF